MNSKAYEALSDLLEPFGEFLPCNMLGQHGYLFHCTTIHQFSDREATYDMHEDMYADLLSLKFDPPRNENVITGIDHISSHMYFSESLVERVNQSGLKGLLFSENLAAPLPHNC